MSIRTLIVDDEEIARQGLRRRLVRAADFTVVGECADGLDAQESILSLAPDVVFLDIRMPELSGLEVLERLPRQRPPRVVFVTAYDEYAVRAFGVKALDYILKPIDDSRFNETLARIRSALAEGRDGQYVRQISEALASITRERTSGNPNPRTDLIAVPSGDRITILKVADVDWVEANGNYVTLHTGKKSWLLRETITCMDGKFTQFGFIRIHRSTLINVDRITELRTSEGGDLLVILRDGTALKSSRNYRDSLNQILGRALS